MLEPLPVIARAVARFRSRMSSHPAYPWAARVGLVLLILAGIYIRVAHLYVRPFTHVDTGGDSLGYLYPALDLLEGKGFGLAPMRTPGYPFVLYLLLLPTHNLLAIDIAQQFLTAGIALLYALAAFNLARSRALSWLVFVALFLHPGLMTLAHSVRVEILYTFLTAALAWLVTLRPPGRGFGHAVALGLTLALLALVRPAGLAMAFVLPAIYLLPPRSLRGEWRLRAARLAAATLVLLMPLGFWSLRNRAVQGTLRVSTMADVQLFGVAGPLMDLDSSLYPDLKKRIRGIVLDYRADVWRKLWNPRQHEDLVYFQYGGPVPVIADYVASTYGLQGEELNRKVEQVCRELAFEGLRTKPLTFVAWRFADFLKLFIRGDYSYEIPSAREVSSQYEEMLRVERISPYLGDAMSRPRRLEPVFRPASALLPLLLGNSAIKDVSFDRLALIPYLLFPLCLLGRGARGIRQRAWILYFFVFANHAAHALLGRSVTRYALYVAPVVITLAMLSAARLAAGLSAEGDSWPGRAEPAARSGEPAAPARQPGDAGPADPPTDSDRNTSAF